MKTSDQPSRHGKLFIVSAPSGTGKTTLCQALREKFPDLAYSISHTTRAPRAGEMNGREYYFISKEAFIAGIENGKWAEWAEVYGNYYGTSIDFLEECLAAGKDILLEIDIRGKIRIVENFEESISIFILPPSIEELERRLAGRGSIAPDDMKRRLDAAADEMAHKDAYRFRIINDDLESAKQALFDIVEACRHGQCTEKTDYP